MGVVYQIEWKSQEEFEDLKRRPKSDQKIEELQGVWKFLPLRMRQGCTFAKSGDLAGSDQDNQLKYRRNDTGNYPVSELRAPFFP